MATVEINLDNFQDTIEKQGIVLLDFWAEWCGPCKMFGPVFESASAKHADITFGKIDTEAQQELAEAAGISAIPTLMLFRDGVLLFRESGALPATALDQVIDKARSLDMEEVRKEIAAHVHEHGPDCDHDHDDDHEHEGHEHGPDCDHDHDAPDGADHKHDAPDGADHKH